MNARPERPLPIELAQLADDLAAAGAQPAPAPDPAFVGALEARLLAAHAHADPRRPRRPVARRLLPFGGTTLVVSAVLVVGAAAAGIVATRTLVDHRDRPDRSEHDVPAPSSTPGDVAPSSHDTASSTAPPTTAAAPVGAPGAPVDTASVTTAPTTVPATTLPSTTAAPATTVSPTTVSPTTVSPTTVPPTTVPPSAGATTTSATPATGPVTTEPPSPAPATSVAPTTTEVHTAAVMSLSCESVPGGVSCSWTPGPQGTVSYVLLRGQSGGGTGRVLTPPPGATSMVDTTGSPGATYLFLVHAVDASGAFIGHSDGVVATVGA